MLTPFLILALLGAVPAGAEELHRVGIADKDLAKIGKDIVGYFAALEIDERRAQVERLAAIETGMAKALKKAKATEPLLTCLGDFERLLELAKPEIKAYKSKIGRGFFRAVFEDVWSGDRVACLLSIPRTYAKSAELLPAIVGLKASLDLSDRDLEITAIKMAQAAYGSIMETHIVLVPLGNQRGQGRSAKISEVDGSWLTDEGLVTLFTGLRILTEQIRFDRGRLILDGWGEAGLDALQLATLSPAWFAGVIVRSGPIGDEDLLLDNLTGLRVLYVHGAADDNDADPQELVRRAGGSPPVDVIDEPGSAVSPAPESIEAMASWLDSSRRDLAPDTLSCMLGDVRFGGGIGWVQVTDIDRRAASVPGDSDFPRLKAVADRSANTIEVESVNVLEMWIYLSDAIVDLDREVVIVVNGEEHVRQRFERNLRTLLDNRYYNNSGEFGLYPARVLVDDIDPNVAR